MNVYTRGYFPNSGERPVRVLIIKISAIGDTVMAMPLITGLRRRDPSISITWVCDSGASELIRALGDVEIIGVNARDLFRGSFREKLSQVLKVWARLFGRRFDLAVIGHSNPTLRLLALFARYPQSRMLSRRERMWPVPGRYHGDEYLRLATGIDGPDAEAAELPRVGPPLSPPLLSLLNGSASDVIAISPGGAKNALNDHPLRRWPLHLYASLAAEISKRGLRVALTGAPTDAWVRDSFRGNLVIDLIGKTSLGDLTALFGSCAAVVTHDSGPLHLALLAGAPTVALFGPTNPEVFVNAAKSPNLRVIWGGEGLPCRPCYDGVDYALCPENRCMGEIPVATVMDRLRELGVFSGNHPNRPEI